MAGTRSKTAVPTLIKDGHKTLPTMYKRNSLDDASHRYAAARTTPQTSRPGKLPQPTVLALVKLYNEMWAQGQLPTSCKVSIVVPTLKPNKPAHDPDSWLMPINRLELCFLQANGNRQTKLVHGNPRILQQVPV